MSTAPPPSQRVPATAATFDPAASARRLNLGCGWDHRDGFVNVDFHAYHHPDLVADVRKLGFLPAQHYEEIVAQDVLEHLPRRQTRAVLRHWNRVLRPGGLIQLRVPNVVALVDMMKSRENQSPDKQKVLMHFLFGTQAYNGDFHLTSFTDVLLRHYLAESGFETTRLESFDAWLYDVTGEKTKHFDGPEVFDFQELTTIPDDAEFVRASYRTLLVREPDAGGFAHYLQTLAAGGSRDEVLGSILNSDECRAKGPYE